MDKSRKQAILTTTTISRPDVDLEVPLDRGEHPSCGKVTGAPTTQKMAREALAEHRYWLVVYMFMEEDEDDSHVALEPASNATEEEKTAPGVSAVRGQVVCLEDYTMVTVPGFA